MNPFLTPILLSAISNIASAFQENPENQDTRAGETVSEGSRWTFKCPHATMGFTRLTVMWQLGDTIWLKIDDGRPIITNRLSQKQVKEILGEKVIQISLNNYRYQFLYDETTGDFMMEINPSDRQDAGMWQCHVNVYRADGRVEQLSTYGRLSILTSNGVFSGDRRYDQSVSNYNKAAASDDYRTDRIFDVQRDTNHDNKQLNGAQPCLIHHQMTITLLFSLLYYVCHVCVNVLEI